ncbi:hypothetical protein [Duganella sp. HH105]|uniref:hypothetical protein n=1 Tax=Duganella sp. HH105 TaxID=1781067 RepID=UPI00114D1858|nr:hypothetical protein [Duganella sp. HH105]
MSRFFVWRELSDWKAGDLPMSAAVAVGIAEHFQVRDAMLISSKLMTDGEVDHEIDRMIVELEKLRKDAKRAIHADNGKVSADVSSRSDDSTL